MKSLGVACIIFLEGFINPIKILGQEQSFAASEKTTLQRPPAAEPMQSASIHKKALEGFNKSYPLASNTSWYVLYSGYRAKCILAGKTYDVFYNNKGKWLYCIKTYAAPYLNATLREAAEEYCGGHKVLQVIEIETIDSEEEPTYIIQMEGPEFYKELRLHNGFFEAWKQLKKQSYTAEK